VKIIPIQTFFFFTAECFLRRFPLFFFAAIFFPVGASSRLRLAPACVAPSNLRLSAHIPSLPSCPSFFGPLLTSR